VTIIGEFVEIFPMLAHIYCYTVVIPAAHKEDQLMWKHTKSKELTFKDYFFYLKSY